MHKKIYKLFISERCRERLTSPKLQDAKLQYFRRHQVVNNHPIVRVRLSDYFHGEYSDNRPQVLKQNKVFSSRERTYQTSVTLTTEQIIDVLNLSKRLNIDPIQKDNSVSHKAGIVYLLSTFLDAVVMEYLIDERQDNDTTY